MPDDAELTPPAWLALDARPNSPAATPLARRLGWARSVVNLAEETSGAETQTHLLRALQKHDFVPPEDWSQAALVLRDHGQGAVEPDDPQICRWATEQALRREVERFAADFFSLSPLARRDRWERLYTAAADLLLVLARLAQLRSALEVNPHRLAGPHDAWHRRLVHHLCELFVLRPAARARRRAELLNEFEPNWDHWREAAEFLGRRHNELTQLDSALVQRLIMSQQVITAAAASRPPEFVNVAHWGANAHLGGSPAASPALPTFVPSSSPMTNWSQFVYALPVIIGFFLLSWLIAHSFEKPRTTAPRNPRYLPAPSIPDLPPLPTAPPRALTDPAPPPQPRFPLFPEPAPPVAPRPSPRGPQSGPVPPSVPRPAPLPPQLP